VPEEQACRGSRRQGAGRAPGLGFRSNCTRRTLTPDLPALAAFLSEHRGLWEPRPFVEGAPPWVGERPALAAWLRGLSPDEVDAFEERPEEHPDAPAELVELAAQARRFELPPPPATGSDLPRSVKVPAAKVAQIEGLLDRLGPPHHQRAVDWCAGKGHLARSPATRTGAPVRAVERDPALCAAGEALAARQGLEVRFRAADVLEEDLGDWIGGGSLLALHACGPLGMEALRLARERKAGSVALAPCCYHKVAHPWLPLSARAGGLLLSPSSLRLATSEEVVASPRLRRARRERMLLRLSVDELMRAATGRDVYHPMRSWPEAWSREGLASLCRHLHQERGLPLSQDPARQDEARRAAEPRVHEGRALGLIRAPFRRPLELWLVADRAAWLDEAGMRVEVLAFCERRLSPRNLLLRAAWPG